MSATTAASSVAIRTRRVVMMRRVATIMLCAAMAALLLGAAGCSQGNPRVATRFNEDASLSGPLKDSLKGDLPVNPMMWRVITSAIDHRDATMFTVFGNDAAIAHEKMRDYPAGAAITLVTWTQQEDPRWFGGNIPKSVKSVEMVTVSASADGKPAYRYESYAGSPLKKIAATESAEPAGRAAYILGLRAAVMP